MSHSLLDKRPVWSLSERKTTLLKILKDKIVILPHYMDSENIICTEADDWKSALTENLFHDESAMTWMKQDEGYSLDSYVLYQ